MSFYDLDPYSPTEGLGDRYYWGWKLKDFNNGLFQGGAYSIALFWKFGYFTDNREPLKIIKSIFYGVKKIQHKNGSVDEAFPYEYAFSVSSTLAFDLLQAYRLVETSLTENDKEEFLKIIEKLIDFISHNPETHGFISNHLATAAAAIEIHNTITGKKNGIGRQILAEIIRHQSEDGYYQEYESADPGYQTLCTYYLAEIYRITEDPALLQSLTRSIEFLSYFIHPDGSIGGEYGSRNTELYYPGGLELLRNKIPLAGAIADRMYESIRSGTTVTLPAIDAGNFIPLIENYLVAYLEHSQEKRERYDDILPYEKEKVRVNLNDAGIVIHGNHCYYSILNVNKGGVFKVFDKQKKALVWDDCGYMGLTGKNDFISTQCYAKKDFNSDENSVKFETGFYKALRETTTPIKFFGLRFLNLTFMRNLFIGNKIKNFIITLLITGKKRFDVKLVRKIHFHEKDIVIEDYLIKGSVKDLKWLRSAGKFSTIHMASSKYFQKQVLTKQIPEIVDVSRLNMDNELQISRKIVFQERK
jgi:hypothetical protein